MSVIRVEGRRRRRSGWRGGGGGTLETRVRAMAEVEGYMCCYMCCYVWNHVCVRAARLRAKWVTLRAHDKEGSRRDYCRDTDSGHAHAHGEPL